MGQFLTRLFTTNSQQEEINVGMLGLDNAGKTTLLYKMLNNNLPQYSIQPTIGFNVESLKYKQYRLKIWDVGGGKPKSRVLWRHYNEKTTRAIIYVIDASDILRLHHAAYELNWLWWRTELSQAIFLIYANKQDLYHQGEGVVVNQKQLVELLELKNVVSESHPWIVQECCALTGEGVWEGLEKLTEMYEHHKMKSRWCLRKN